MPCFTAIFFISLNIVQELCFVPRQRPDQTQSSCPLPPLLAFLHYLRAQQLRQGPTIAANSK